MRTLYGLVSAGLVEILGPPAEPSEEPGVSVPGFEATTIPVAEPLAATAEPSAEVDTVTLPESDPIRVVEGRLGPTVVEELSEFPSFGDEHDAPTSHDDRSPRTRPSTPSPLSPPSRPSRAGRRGGGAGRRAGRRAVPQRSPQDRAARRTRGRRGARAGGGDRGPGLRRRDPARAAASRAPRRRSNSRSTRPRWRGSCPVSSGTTAPLSARSSPASPRGAAPPTPPKAPPVRKRVEDDEQVTKGLISRLIDGVKGL